MCVFVRPVRGSRLQLRALFWKRNHLLHRRCERSGSESNQLPMTAMSLETEQYWSQARRLRASRGRSRTIKRGMSMKCVLLAVGIALPVSGQVKAQKSEPVGVATRHRPVQSELGAETRTPPHIRLLTWSRSEPSARQPDTDRGDHSDARNGALIGGALGLTAGAVAGGVLSSNCASCYGFSAHARYVAGYGAVGAVSGVLIGAIAGHVFGLMRRD
jgi:hypothetical protein